MRRDEVGDEEHLTSDDGVAFVDALLEFEQQCTSPLKRATTTLNLSTDDLACIMDVTRQTVEEWLSGGLPAERLTKIGAIAEISDILRHWLREGMPAVVARRPAKAYDGRTMLEVLADDDHEWLLEDVRESFNFASVA